MVMKGMITKVSIAGAACYAIWGCLHIYAVYSVFMLGDSVPGMVLGRLHQSGWNLFFFGVTAIGVALTLNIRNSKWGYWINLGILALADTGLIFFVLIPGYWSWWPASLDRSCGWPASYSPRSPTFAMSRRARIAAMNPKCEKETIMRELILTLFIVLVPLGEARLGRIGFDEWLRRSRAAA
jgi:hypothetical protein